MLRSAAIVTFEPNSVLRCTSFPHSAGDFTPGAGGTYLPMVLNNSPMKLSGVQLARPIFPAGRQTRTSSLAASSCFGVNMTPKVEARRLGLDRVAFAGGKEFLEVRDHDRIHQRGASRLQLSDIFRESRIDDLEVRGIGVRLIPNRLAENADARSVQRTLVEISGVAALDLSNAERGHRIFGVVAHHSIQKLGEVTHGPRHWPHL